MRKLAFFTLGMYISVIFSAFVLASSPVPGVTKSCSSAVTISSATATALKDGTLLQSASETYATDYKSYQTKVDGGITFNTCGEKNTTTGSYEIGDCAEGSTPKLVTEILEPVGPAGETSDGKIIDLYKGVCCIAGAKITIYNSDGTTKEGDFYCDSSRNVYFATYDECNTGANFCSKVQWLIASTGAGILKTYVKQIYVFGAGVVGFIAVATIVGSGIQISVSGATGDITAAKDRITQSIMGIALLFLSALILYTINPTFFY